MANGKKGGSNLEALTIKKYLNGIEEGEKINYIDIVNKLTKNDYYQYEPSDAVVSSYLIKHLQSAVENIKVDESNTFIDCIVTTKTGKRLAAIQASHQFKLYTGLEFPF